MSDAQRIEENVYSNVKIFLSTDTMEGVFGSGKWKLLDAVRRTGSLHEAAQVLGRSYRKAWGDIQRAEKGLGRRLVIRTRGGAHGGTTRLTEYGERLLDAWDRHWTQVTEQVRVSFDRHLRDLFDSD